MKTATLLCVLLASASLQAAEYYVSPSGSDQHTGSSKAPFKTISAAAAVAQAGDVITVQAGVYRERINPPRGGTSDDQRITYRAAEGAKVAIKGSELITGWKKVKDDTWTVTIPNTLFGDFNPYSDLIRGDWFGNKGRPHHTGAVYLNGHWLTEAAKLDEVMAPATKTLLWFGAVDNTHTTLHAQFTGNPNEQLVEINVRQSVFYPDQPGRNYITVRGLILEHAATPWAPPTAEQIGLIGCHWSKGWVIEHNTIRYSTCTGVTLGKYGDEWDNKAQSAKGYVGTINRALQQGWSKDQIGHHRVQHNHISHCEQAGIVGSMGAAFSTISDNHIHHCHFRQLFSGAEMAGIKFHAAIDTLIRNNRIHHCQRGIWLDWMSQGTRVTQNLLHDNGPEADLFMEVNHGPFLVDHNLFLSSHALMDWSQGGAYVHNLFAGKITSASQSRETPYHKPHATAIAGLKNINHRDNQFYNNLFANGSNFDAYKEHAEHLTSKGNATLKGSIERFENNGEWLAIKGAIESSGPSPTIVTSETLGQAVIPKLPFVQPDDSPYCLDTDLNGKQRSRTNITAGPVQLELKSNEISQRIRLITPSAGAQLP